MKKVGTAPTFLSKTDLKKSELSLLFQKVSVPKCLSLVFLMMTFLFISSALATEFYVSPSGSASGNGSSASPWDLQTALADNTNSLNKNFVVKPADTIWLRGGTYLGRFSSALTGGASGYITVRSFPGEQAIIDGNKTITLAISMPSAVPNSSGSMTVSDSTGMFSSLVIKVEDEFVQVASVNGNNLRVNRAWNGTAATTHAQGALVKIVGDILTVKGQYTIFQDLIILNSNPIRLEDRNLQTRGTGINVYGTHVKIVNNIIHDAGQGIGFWVQAVDSELYGNIIYNNGYQNKDLAIGSGNWINGHGIYTQNDQGLKTISDNIIFNQFGLGFHAYSTKSVLNNFLISGNIHFNDRFLIGGLTPATNIDLEENYFFNGAMSIGYSNPDNNGIIIKNNYLADGLVLQLSKNVMVTGNTIWGWTRGNNATDISLRLDGTNNKISDYTFSNNIYYQPTESYPYHQFSISLLPNSCGSYFWFNNNNNGYGYGHCTNNSWQQNLGFDLNSTLIPSAPPSKVIIRPNKYDANRAHIIIYNWDAQSVVNLDLSSVGFKSGDRYQIRNGENYLNEIVSGTYNGSVISVPMTSWTIAEPLGATSDINSSLLGSSTFPKFGIFVLIKTPKGNDYYASPSGLASGDGSITNPWDLQSAFNGAGGKIKSGDTLWLRGGIYVAPNQVNIDNKMTRKLFVSRLNGQPGLPITIRQYSDERATIDGGIEVQGAWPIFWGFEIMNSDTNRAVCASERPSGLNFFARGAKVINMVIHDVGHPGIGFWRPVGDRGELYGNIFWSNSTSDTCTPPGSPEKPWFRASATYMQNEDGIRYIHDNISFWSGNGLKNYGENTSGFDFQGNILFNNSSDNLFITSNGVTTKRLKILNNYTYREKIDSRGGVILGLFSSTYGVGDDVEVRGNYLVNGDFIPWPKANGQYPQPIISIGNFNDVIFTDNTLIGDAVDWNVDTSRQLKQQWDHNTYWINPLRNKHPNYPFTYNTSNAYQSFSYRSYYFTDWQGACHCDSSSTFNYAYPTSNMIVVRPNKYEPGRANLVVYNWQHLTAVYVDVSVVLNTGDRYEVRDVQNYYGKPITQGVYSGGSIVIPMDKTAITQPIGSPLPLDPVHTSSEFGAFVLIKTKSASTEETMLAGDVSGDGKVTMYDAALLLRYTLGSNLSDNQKKAADINADGKIDGADVMAIARKALGL